MPAHDLDDPASRTDSECALDEFTNEDGTPAPAAASAPPLPDTNLEHQEFHGAVVAVVLAVAVVGYGLLLVSSSRASVADTGPRAPWRRVAAPVVTPSQESAEAVAASHGPQPDVMRLVHASAAPAQRMALSPNAPMLTALWQRRDTRSLQRAFATLRTDTLAFHRCRMQMTAVDRAVARCEGIATGQASDGEPVVRSTVWRLDFQRVAGRWRMARVSTR